MRRRSARCALLFVVRERRLIASSASTEQWIFTGGSFRLVHDVGVLDLRRLVDRLALEPLGGQARRGDRAAAAEGLELGVLDDTGFEVDLDLPASSRRRTPARRPGPYPRRRLLAEGPDVARLL